MQTDPQFHRTVFQANMGFLEGMIDWVRKVTSDCPFTVSDRRKIEIALEEAFVNVVCHAYRGEKAPVEIICCKHPSRHVAFKIIDKGLPFNPLLQPKSSHSSLPIEERQEGGLGIFFMTKFMDEVHYERHHPFNVLTLVKHTNG
jgi:serine/threonine-protein kinase RsbW